MSHEIRIGDTAPQVWKKLMSEHRILLLGGNRYQPSRHGIPSENLMLSPATADELPNLNLPLFSAEKGLIAVGLAVDNNAFVGVDMDCPDTREWKDRIVGVMQKDYASNPWILLETGGGFHIIIDSMVRVEHIPWHWGKLVASFSEIEEGDNKFFFEMLGKAMQGSWSNWEALATICSVIDKNICHYDERNGEKISFPVDLRWIRHSLFEHNNYLLMGKRYSNFGYLRISNDKNGNSPPVVSDLNTI